MTAPTTALRFPQAADDPYALRVTVRSTDDNFDLTDATVGYFDVKYSDGTTTTWTSTLSDQAATSLLMTHVFEAADVPDAEVITIVPRLEGFGTMPLVGSYLKLTIYNEFTGSA